MSEEWKIKTCERCVYRKDGKCYYNPPSVYYEDPLCAFATFPRVKYQRTYGCGVHDFEIYYEEACSHYKEQE